ncbi:MAG: GNAT family N-acetyltransferase [Gemmatimonadales bacterium]|nr:GNAT family N-acetyltransferase [Gemmatimonadales bacterium]MBP9201062.1 GNAT family N-acetyltransferase [Gemmatimonadales bacterium]
MATQFQQLGPADADLLAGHLVRWRRLEGISLEPAHAAREAARMLGDDQLWHAWLIRAADRTVGYLVLRFRHAGPFEPPLAHLAGMYVEPAARRQGIARQARALLLDLGRWLQVRVIADDFTREERHAEPFARPATIAPRGPAYLPRRAIA